MQREKKYSSLAGRVCNFGCLRLSLRRFTLCTLPTDVFSPAVFPVFEHLNCARRPFAYLTSGGCASALKGRLFVSEAISLGAQTFAPSSASTPFARFIPHAHSRRPCPSTPNTPPSSPHPNLSASFISLCALVSNWRRNRQPSAEATHIVLSSTHDCDGHVYNVI